MTERLKWLEDERNFVIEKLEQNLETFKYQVPPAASEGLVYKPEANTDWTASFWLGMLFLGKEMTKDNRFDEVIGTQMASFDDRIKNKIALETHDIGFLYTLSAIADYRVNGNQTSVEMAIAAADELMTRYSEKAQIIQAWGDLNDPSESGRMIIDCLMNLPLLYIVSDLTGNPKYREAAYLHAKQTQRYIVRDNYTTYHTYFFDTATGEALRGETAQGYSDDSCWARGQAWGIYGFTLSYLYTGDQSFLETARHLADYFMTRLPENQVAYWDLIFMDGEEERETSAVSIAACGLLELAKQLPLSDDSRQTYETLATEMMKSLAEHYTTKEVTHSNGILLEGVYDKNSDKGVKECMIWGDYYYVEALVRLSQPWYRYW